VIFLAHACVSCKNTQFHGTIAAFSRAVCFRGVAAGALLMKPRGLHHLGAIIISERAFQTKDMFIRSLRENSRWHTAGIVLRKNGNRMTYSASEINFVVY
jgi:hypothetical protein